MGYYLETGTVKNKAAIIEDTYGAVQITLQEAEFFVNEREGAVICVVDNGPFEAAAFIYNDDALQTFRNPNDPRQKTWLLVDDRGAIERATGFKPKTVKT
jgi:hypothetical protein